VWPLCVGACTARVRPLPHLFGPRGRELKLQCGREQKLQCELVKRSGRSARPGCVQMVARAWPLFAEGVMPLKANPVTHLGLAHPHRRQPVLRQLHPPPYTQAVSRALVSSRARQKAPPAPPTTSYQRPLSRNIPCTSGVGLVGGGGGTMRTRGWPPTITPHQATISSRALEGTNLVHRFLRRVLAMFSGRW
jgi:hypothetical protein